jgi:hypothetical protein
MQDLQRDVRPLVDESLSRRLHQDFPDELLAG